jgi:hypothetical protein
MTRDAVPLDVQHLPDLARLAREVQRTRTPVELRENGEDVAVLFPAPPKRRTAMQLTPAQREAFLASAGGWKGLVDVQQFKREIKAARGSRRPPVEL